MKRRCQFAKRFSIEEDEQLKAWHVRFKLLEVDSVPEKRQQQRESAQQQQSQPVVTDSGQQVLKRFDKVKG